MPRRWRLLQISGCTQPRCSKHCLRDRSGWLLDKMKVCPVVGGLSRFRDKCALHWLHDRFRVHTELHQLEWSSRVPTEIGETNLPASLRRRRLWIKNVREVRHHAGRPQRVTVLHSRGCTDIGESGLEPVLHKIGLGARRAPTEA